jgi:hypothetical protein
MAIELIYLAQSRTVRGTRAERGQGVFAIKKGDLYFIWAYTDEGFAKQMDAKLTGPTDDADKAANWRSSPLQLVPTDRNSFA